MSCKRCCAAFATLIYGCRCKRNARRSTSSSERVWFVFLILSLFLTFINMYLWLVSANEEHLFDLGFWKNYQLDFRFYFAFQIASLVLFGYPFLLLMFACLHMNLKEHLHLHVIHKVLLFIVDIITITILVLSVVYTRFLWHFIPLSLMFFGPFLHLLAVITMTIITWFVAGAFGTIEKKGNPVRDLTVWYFLLLLALYACPLFIKSPCILDDKDLPDKPRLFAHKGAEHIAPENTAAAFQRAVDDCEVYGIESDVRISTDGVHFCLHDSTLERTTNVAELFPSKIRTRAELFDIADLKSLNAGTWFLEKDPFGTVSELTDEQRSLYQKQKIPNLTELLDLKDRVNILFDLMPPPEGHPYHDKFVDHTKEKLKEYGVEEMEMDIWQAPNGPHFLVLIKKFDKRKLENVYSDISFNSIREKTNNGVSTNVWTINKKWVFSLFWCGQTFSVTTSYCRDLRDMNGPSWQLTNTHYLIMWIMYDVVSFMWVLIFLICQIRRKRKQTPPVEDAERQPETLFQIQQL